MTSHKLNNAITINRACPLPESVNSDISRGRTWSNSSSAHPLLSQLFGVLRINDGPHHVRVRLRYAWVWVAEGDPLHVGGQLGVAKALVTGFVKQTCNQKKAKTRLLKVGEWKILFGTTVKYHSWILWGKLTNVFPFTSIRWIHPSKPHGKPPVLEGTERMEALHIIAEALCYLPVWACHQPT